MLQKIMGNSRIWSWNSLQYLCFATIAIFDMIYIQFPPLWCRLLLAIALLASPFIPYIRRFTVPAMAIFTWLITFYAVQFFPNNIKPQHIFVNILPTLERIIYGANLSEIISKHTHPVLDILAWLPYGVIHFAFPFLLAAILFVFGPPTSVAVFAQAFGYMNLAGVLTQLCFPTSPPWYELTYGSAPADYSVHGQPGGLARIDDILGLTLYGTTFGNSPLVFGAFPSLHSGCATIEMLFVGWLFPKMRIFCVFHVMWMWFATMYLTHHYLIDLVGGSIYATLAFFFFHRYLPTIRPECLTRLDYIDSKVPVKRTIGNFFRSIEMEKFVATLSMHERDDTEAHLLMEEVSRGNDTILHSEDEDVVNVLSDSLDREDSTNTFDHIPLYAVKKNKPVSIFTSGSPVPSTSTSPTCSGPPSPATPHSDLFLENDYKLH